MGNVPKYERSNLLNTVEIVKDGVIEQHLELFSQKYVTLLDNIKSSVPYNNVIKQPLTTISQNQYNTTSLWWLIAFFNGSINPLDISTEKLLKIPNKADLEALFSDVPQSRTGETVTI